MKTDLRIPHFFLLSLARLCLREKDRSVISAFLRDRISGHKRPDTDIFWNELLASAAAQGISGFLWYHLRSSSFALPEKIIRRLERKYRETEANTLARMAEAAVISERCRAAGIGIMGIQGISIVRLYRHPGLRPMGDTDLMVKPDHKEKLRNILADAGYTPVFPYPDLWRKNSLLLDVHTHIMNLERIPERAFVFPENMDAMWQRAGPFFPSPKDESAGGLLCPDPFDNFTALAAHAMKHGYSRLIWLADLHELAGTWENSDNAWRELLARARFWEQERGILYALLLLEGMFGLSVPLWLKEALETRNLSLPEKLCLNAVIRGICATDLGMVLCLCHIRGMQRKVRFIKANLFPRQDIMKQTFPRSPSPDRYGNYLRRIRDIVFRNLRILWEIR